MGLTFGEDFTRNAGEFVGKSVQEVIQLLCQLCASIVWRLQVEAVSCLLGSHGMSQRGERSSYGGGLGIGLAVLGRHVVKWG